jgi:DNA transformation protein
MFGGVGLYSGERFFAVMMDDTVYLKVDETTRAPYEAAGSRPFNPYPTRPDGGVSTSYFEVPLAVLEDAEKLARWAKKSIAVAGKPKPKKTRSARPPKKRKTRQ